MAAAFDLVVPSIAELYREHHEHVRSFARRLLRDEASAEDLVQETFLALPNALRSYRGDSPLRSFVLGVAANHARHHVRSATRRRAAHERSARHEDLAPPSTPHERAERRELAETLTRALEELPDDQRSAILLCEVEERTAAEAAKIVGAKEATIRTRVFNAKKKLRAILFVTMTLVISAAWAAYPSLVTKPVNLHVPVPVDVPRKRPVEAPQPIPPTTITEKPEPAPPKPVVTPQPKPTAKIDRETPLYENAHEAHFVARDPAQALAAWDAYLAVYPTGRFAPEARYNRAISLLRLGRRDEAREALAPFADGTYGDYRKREAKKLRGTLR